MAHNDSNASDRREFLRHSSAWMGAGVLAANASSCAATGAAATTASAGRFHADSELRIALVGCGGRGTGAAMQALSTEGPVRLVAMADAFSDRLDSSLAALAEEIPERVDVPAERRFVGFDAYERAMALDVDVVVLATPPGFRPIHFEHAIASGKHVFMEKPVAVDAPGVRRVLAAAREATEKNLKVGVGLQRHHDPRYHATIERIRSGAIGDVRLLRCYWNGVRPWVRAREASWNEMTYQMRNWYYFNWLCGDHIVEQHIHNLDVCNWIMRGHPVAATGMGGRQDRDNPDQGEIFDHHSVEFTYADGTTMLSQCRQIKGCWNSVSEHATGTEGSADVSGARITGVGGWEWQYDGETPNPYQVEHDDLFAAIRSDTPYNEGENGAIATMTAIFGRMATYSGKRLLFDDALASELVLAPDRFGWDQTPRSVPDAEGRYAIPMPGTTLAL